MLPSAKLLALLVFASLATYRVSLALTREAGPFDLFAWLRDRFTGASWVAEGVRCAYCVSVWVGLSLAGLLAFQGYLAWGDILIAGLGFSGATLVLDKYWARR